jgi:hypothetical protein
MSYTKEQWEDENAGSDPFARCAICGEFKDECICGDVATEGHVYFPGDEAALADAIDEHVTRTPEELTDEAYFGPWAEAMVKAEVSRGMLDGMWERIKIKLDDLGKVDQLIADVWGHRTWMVDR